jgi:hypothetical protein
MHPFENLMKAIVPLLGKYAHVDKLIYILKSFMESKLKRFVIVEYISILWEV